MWSYEAVEPFIDWFDPASERDEKGNHVDWKDRKLLPDAPQSAIDAFEEWRKLEKQAEKEGVYL
jgi:hypothetical protein